MHGNVNLFDLFLDYVLDVLPNYLHLSTHLLELSLYISLFFLFFLFLYYESMITHLQEACTTQNKVTYSSTI